MSQTPETKTAATPRGNRLVRKDIAEEILRVINDRVARKDPDFIAHLTHVPDKKFENACIPLDYFSTLEPIQRRLNSGIQGVARVRLLSNILTDYPQQGLRVVKGEDSEHPLLSLPYTFQGRNALKMEDVPKECREVEIRSALAEYKPASQPIVSEGSFPGRWLVTFDKVADAEALLAAINAKPLYMGDHRLVKVMLRPQCFNPIAPKAEEHPGAIAPSSTAAPAAAQDTAAAAPAATTPATAAPQDTPAEQTESPVPAATAPQGSTGAGEHGTEIPNFAYLYDDKTGLYLPYHLVNGDYVPWTPQNTGRRGRYYDRNGQGRQGYRKDQRGGRSGAPGGGMHHGGAQQGGYNRGGQGGAQGRGQRMGQQAGGRGGMDPKKRGPGGKYNNGGAAGRGGDARKRPDARDAREGAGKKDRFQRRDQPRDQGRAGGHKEPVKTAQVKPTSKDFPDLE